MSDVIIESARLAILRFLAEDGDYSHNTSVLQDLLDQIGFGMSRDQLETLCAWLAEQGLVTIGQHGTITVVVLTQRGGDVAAGRARTPGVKRPSPADIMSAATNAARTRLGG